MKRNFALLLSAILLMVACSQLPETPPAPLTSAKHSVALPASTGVPAKQSLNPAVQLQGWYNQTVKDCGSATRPAFLCSGVMLRGTLSRQSYLPWDPSPGSITSGGVSFAWIRTDTNFKQLPLNYNNGYIFYPAQDTPPGKKSDIQVLCTFPFDGWTDIRNQQGCGTNTSYPTQSRPCNEQGINTGLQWINHFNAAPDKYKAQCGWNVREGQANTADRFYQSIDGRSRITSTHWNGNNELRLATWPTGSGAQLPIQSFFYVAGTTGLVSAQDDQRRYYAAYGQVVPVVQLTFASDRTGKASFVYREGDQVVEGEHVVINFEDMPLKEYQKEIVTAHGTFRFKGSSSGWMAVRDRTPPSKNISGHHLFAKGDAWPDIEFVLTIPTNRVSFDVDYPGDGIANTGAIMHLSDGSEKEFITESPSQHLDYTAPAGLTIVSFETFSPPGGNALDNLRIYK